MKKIYFGKYIPRDSFIHNLHPLVKVSSIAVIATLLVALGSNYYALGFMTLLLILLLIISKISFKEIYNSIKSFRFLFIFIFVTRVFFTESGSFTIYLTKDMIITALIVMYQFVLIISFSSILTFTTSPTNITKSLYFFVKPLKLFKVNTQNIAMSLLIAVRFIPLIFEEADKIITAQKLRGMWITDFKFKEKIRFIFNMDSLLIPLLVRVFNYAEQMSITLSYRQNIDDVLKIDRIKTADILFIISLIICLVPLYVLL